MKLDDCLQAKSHNALAKYTRLFHANRETMSKHCFQVIIVL